MMRISALNEDSDSSSNDGNEPEVTREAQETIAISEYVRALDMKRHGKTDAALCLFLDLLQTQVLHDVDHLDKTGKLFSVKYNCYRNLCFIYEERGENEKALDYIKKAIRMDDTDIFTLNKTGHLCLQFDETELACIVFQKCQELNSNHWPSADGLLQVLCAQCNFMDAYGWAMHWHKKDSDYERAIKVLVELHEKFNAVVPMFEDMFKAKFDYEKYKHVRPEPSCFRAPKYPDPNTMQVKYRDVSRFRVAELTWLSVGDWIINVYEECRDDPENLIRIHTWDDLLIKEDQPPEGRTNENGELLDGGGETDQSNRSEQIVPDKGGDGDSELETATEGGKFLEPAVRSSDESSDVRGDSDKDKPKKRRGSDLSFLEQWGWHKNRRHSRKKSLPTEPVEQEDMSIGTFLKRVFAKYYQIAFDAKDSPFEADETEVLSKEERPHHHDFKAPPTEQETDFQKLTQCEFEAFRNEFETVFDVIPLLYKWLEYTSRFWNMNFPPQIAEQYVKIYAFYLTHYEFHQWAQMDYEEFKTVFWMGLFYVEQVQELVHKKMINKSEMDEEFQRLRNQLMFHTGYYCLNVPEEYLTRICRYHWNNYLVSKLENNYEQCLESLDHIALNLEQQPQPFTLQLPSKKEDGFVELELIKGLIKALKRTISLNNVGRLYKAEKFKELIPILKDSLINSTTIKGADNSVMKLQTQFEILLECLWNEDFEGCLVWAEKCFKYCIDLYETFPEFSYRLKEWGAVINFILIYLDALVKKHGVDLLMLLGRTQCRLIQNLIRLIVHQLDTPLDKNNPEVHAVNLKIPWILLYLVRQRDEVSNCPLVGLELDSNENSREEEEAEDEDHIPKSFLLLFTAHEHLGKKSWCTRDGGELLRFTLKSVGPLLRTPLMEPFRDLLNEYLEQVTYCLFAYPPKKGRSRHIEEHDAAQMELNWENAIDLFDIYRPDVLPDFDAYKVDSITVDMEQLLQKVLPLIPSALDLNASTALIKEFINGRAEKLPELNSPQFPHRIASIYYLIADYHFKNRDFTKPTKFYVLDLALHPWRFDSWAGLALSKATKAETKINLCNSFNAQDFLVKSENAMRCFETCLKLRDKHTMLWIEYGSFTYMLHSYCSRSLKHTSEKLSMEAFAFMETYKDKFLKIAYNCFHTVDLYLLAASATETAEDEEGHDEKWLYHYMLGKVAEKKKEPPRVYMEHYLKASKYLYECNATYPIRINHSNPPNLSIEALEIFYRITSSIIKYLEQHEVVKRDVGKLFEKMLRELSTSPFAYNKAKLDNNSINALKRKLANQEDQQKPSPPPTTTPDVEAADKMEIEEKIEPVIVEKKMKVEVLPAGPANSPSRRVSQESTATSVTTTTSSRTTRTSSTSSSSSSSDSSSDDEEEDVNSNLSERELELIYSICVKNFEECLARFPEHYKSVNRLVHHFMYAPQKLRDMKKARELLLGTYVTSMGNKVQGLFSDRKGSNFFNGIWRIPSSEIDRPGSFAAHLSKGLVLLLEVLKASAEYEITFDLAMQLHKSPDPDKKYIKDSECKELLQQALSCCCTSFRDLLRKHSAEKRSDHELINLMLEVFKMYRKCMKQIPGKEGVFTPVLIDVYKAYIEDKVRKLPEHFNLQDLATKFCNQEINRRKTIEKTGQMTGPINLPGIPISLLEFPKSTAGGLPKSSMSLGIPNLPRSTTISVAPQTTTADGGGLAFNTAAMPVPKLQNPSKIATGSNNNNQGNSANGKPRGRPVGSKNITAPATGAPFMKSMMGNFDPKMMGNIQSLMNLYSSPAIQNDPEAANKLIMEYYKLLLGASPIGMNAGGPSSLLHNPQTMKPSTTAAALIPPVNTPPLPVQSAPPKPKPKPSATATGNSGLKNPQPGSSSAHKSMPKYDMKSLIESVASNILTDPLAVAANKQQQAASTISLGGGQLTITPTKAKPMEMAPQSGKAANKNAPDDHHMIKKSYLPDLPKSLTITPHSMGPTAAGAGKNKSGGSAKQAPAPASVSMSKVPNVSQKDVAAAMAQLKKYQSPNQMMMSLIPGTPEYEVYMKTLQAAYTDLMRGGAGGGRANPTNAPLPQSKQTKKQKSQVQQPPKSTPQQMSHQSSAPKMSKSNASTSYPLSAMPRFPNQAFQEQQQSPSNKSPNPMHILAGLSVAGLSSTPSSAAVQSSLTASPPKTLQQKLAERQKANSLLEKTATNQK